MLGLVLTAGGARGAYQAGVLKRVGEIRALRDEPSPFAIVTGASAGAINGTAVAGGSGSFHEATRQLAALWSALRVEDVFRTDLISLGWGAAGLLRDMVLGGLLGHTVTQSLFDTAPLRGFLANKRAESSQIAPGSRARPHTPDRLTTHCGRRTASSGRAPLDSFFP
jgi:NTE family protein